MARGKSVIEVAIVGDARKLVSATQDADKATGGLLTSVGKLSVAGIGIASHHAEMLHFVQHDKGPQRKQRKALSY